jgi:hypothetical protein
MRRNSLVVNYRLKNGKEELQMEIKKPDMKEATKQQKTLSDLLETETKTVSSKTSDFSNDDAIEDLFADGDDKPLYEEAKEKKEADAEKIVKEMEEKKKKQTKKSQVVKTKAEPKKESKADKVDKVKPTTLKPDISIKDDDEEETVEAKEVKYNERTVPDIRSGKFKNPVKYTDKSSMPGDLFDNIIKDRIFSTDNNSKMLAYRLQGITKRELAELRKIMFGSLVDCMAEDIKVGGLPISRKIVTARLDNIHNNLMILPRTELSLTVKKEDYYGNKTKVSGQKIDSQTFKDDDGQLYDLNQINEEFKKKLFKKYGYRSSVNGN